MSRKFRHIAQKTDEELLTAYRKEGASEYVGELFQRYTEMVYLVSMKYLKDPMEAEDMTMRVFEKLMKDLKKYEVRSFRYWLHTVVKNQCLAHLDREKKMRDRTEDFKLEQREIMETGEELSLLGELDEEEQMLVHLEVAMTRLNDQQKLCVELFYLQKKSYQEVTELTGFSMKQVKSFIQNGKRNLKNHVMDLADETRAEL